ncbi:MAG: homoserine kinase [Cenarchaeum sp. SB0665_bin_23]|nr:homoserine kinase [Cenarchaeum sp. SB0667_bin_13]MXY37420.1 homoserine kinase [Cenarchaeum sp. SB0664_bin_35]MXY60834.1 homoserine kinase [Cenarchaeum sp. SB0665_bin_23]MXZ92891.1 homoserine kinase [Cenarchaeum sp. SB0666_bin_15]MYB46371.1 homoserine kinase [Cenarchaeum sp. SB0662_bin_33]MYC79111.1 homoserine kinase [Cenarchaeum sp. SB0661_bin_35]MYD59196.1 homoserine kinase [Cenarchaeum sp. SB0678_bin_8]MYG33092.1 homoserine kinase [Cenarchaeum sp. SB0677_bin_16]MYI51472.1 homoserine ki
MITAQAPSSTANLGPGFDVFGMALDACFDTVSVAEEGSSITISSDDDIPLEYTKNTAGIVVDMMRTDFDIKPGVHIKIRKGVPAGYGMGSSAASAAAAATAYSNLYNLNLSLTELTRYAGYGEQASAGSIHYDNVAASVCGGFVMVHTKPLRVINLRPPENLTMCVAVPDVSTPEKKTQVSRGVIPEMVPLCDVTTNISFASSLVAGMCTGDISLIGDSLQDVIVEPARRHMIPALDDIRNLAVSAGAAGVTISGAGPSVIAFADGSIVDIDSVGEAMREGFGNHDINCKIFPCKSAKGAGTVQ